MGWKINLPLDPSWEIGYKYFVAIWPKWGKGIANKTFCFPHPLAREGWLPW